MSVSIDEKHDEKATGMYSRLQDTRLARALSTHDYTLRQVHRFSANGREGVLQLIDDFDEIDVHCLEQGEEYQRGNRKAETKTRLADVGWVTLNGLSSTLTPEPLMHKNSDTRRVAIWLPDVWV